MELDLSLNGNHQITCPLCQHIHYRVVKDGEVTEERWRSSSWQLTGPVYIAQTSITITTMIRFNYAAQQATTAASFLSQTWLNTTNNIVLS